MGYKEDFISIYQEHISREGSKELLEWLQTTDFFTAPASTKFHCACTGGLVQHSVKVYQVMMEKHLRKARIIRKASRSALCFMICAKPSFINALPGT